MLLLLINMNPLKKTFPFRVVPPPQLVRVFPECAVESLEQEDTEAAFYALTLSRVEAFKLMHIPQKFKGRKSERKSEHMTLLKDTPQLAFCIGSAWQTPGAERKILLGWVGLCGGLQDGF